MPTQPDLTCKKIGVEEVSGRTCDHWEITDKQGKVSNFWIDQKLHFPVKVTSQDATMLLTNIKEGEPDASLFQIPPGFHKIDMGGMMPPGAGRPPHSNSASELSCPHSCRLRSSDDCEEEPPAIDSSPSARVSFPVSRKIDYLKDLRPLWACHPHVFPIP